MKPLPHQEYDGGPAFPMRGINPGMTLRDYFAAKALPVVYGTGYAPAVIATRAYALADAMLEARKA
jgi:hypothetical protein